MQSLLDRLLIFAVNLWCGVWHHAWYRRYFEASGTVPNVAFPRSVNEKFFWRKLFDHDPRFTVVTDKLACKDWVRQRVPELAAPAVLWQGSDPDDIPDPVLSGDVVVKSSHGWNANFFVRGGRYDRADLTAQARKWLLDRHGRRKLEWAYYDIPPRLFVEEMVAGAGPDLEELKLYTFGSWIERVVHILDRFGDARTHVWDADAEGRLVRRSESVDPDDTGSADPLPPTLDRALDIARRIGVEFDHMRVDLLTSGDDLWLGELTVYNRGGHVRVGGRDPDTQAARAWDIRRSAFLRTPPENGWRGAYARALARALARDLAQPAWPATVHSLFAPDVPRGQPATADESRER